MDTGLRHALRDAAVRPLPRRVGPLSLAAVIVSIGALVMIALGGFTPAKAQPASAATTDTVVGPAMGWSSWSFIRRDPTEAGIEAQATALQSSGLQAAGYNEVNLDDYWYQCPGAQGPNVDAYGRWVTNATRFPPDGTTDGIAATAAYVHSLGEKFGLYVTPGISNQAVAENTPILGTDYHADDIADPSVSETNYNCHGMDGIDFSQPGAQEFINSWADELAGWGVDEVKLDGVGANDIPDIQAWSTALAQTGRPMQLELSNTLDITDASTWQQTANSWRTGHDIECYCGGGGASYPLTDWAHVATRFDQVADWAPYGGDGRFNDYDSIEVGNGSNDGLTPAERQSQLSLWALGSAPLILGTDLTALDPTDLADLTNGAVIAVDQDGLDASRIVDDGDQQVYAKTEPDGDVVLGLFNASATATEDVSVPLADAGLPGTATATDLWTGLPVGDGEISGTYTVTLGPGAVQLIRATPDAATASAAPTASPSVSLSPDASASPSDTSTPTAAPTTVAPSVSPTTVSTTTPTTPGPTASAPAGGLAPSGSVTTPRSGVTLKHGRVLVSGTASDDAGVAHAYLTVQNRVTGQWLTAKGKFAAGYQRLAVTLTRPKARTSAWSKTLSVPTGKVTLTLIVVDVAGTTNTVPRPSVAFTLR